MKRKNMGNQAVIKAITLGLSAVMATAQPISVLAAEGDDVTPVADPPVVEAEGEEASVPAVVIPEAAAPSTVVAEAALGVAVAEEKEAAKEAVLTVGAGIISDEALAILLEQEAAKNLAAANTAMGIGEKRTEQKLDAANEKLDDVDDNLDSILGTEESTGYVGDAQEQQQIAEDALAAANAAGSSSAARVQAGIAGEAAEKADQDVADAEAAKEEADGLYEQALADYNAAAERAEYWTNVANAKLLEGAVDADLAYMEAQKALNEAYAIKIATWTNEKITGYIENAAEKKHDWAAKNLEDQKKKLEEAWEDEKAAAKDVVDTGATLLAADAWVAATWVIDELADLNVAEKEKAVKDLEQKKADAEATIAQAKEDLKGLKKTAGTESKEYQEAADALSAAEKAYKELDGTLTKLNEDLKKENAALESLNAELEDLQNNKSVNNDEVWEQAIEAAESKLIDATKMEVTDEESQKAKDKAIKDAELELVGAVIAHHLAGDDDKKVELNKEGKFEVTTTSKSGEETKAYYDYVINPTTQQVEVYEYNRDAHRENVVKESTTFDNEAGFNAAIAGKEEGKDYVVEFTKGSEAEYTVSYYPEGVDEYLSTTESKHMTGAEFKAEYGTKLPEGATFSVRKWVPILGDVDYLFELKDGKWMCYWDATYDTEAWGKGELRNDDKVTVLLPKLVPNPDYKLITAENVPESKLGEYLAVDSTPTKAAVADKWDVTFYDNTKAANQTEKQKDALIKDLAEDEYVVTPTQEAYAGSYSSSREVSEDKSNTLENVAADKIDVDSEGKLTYKDAVEGHEYVITETKAAVEAEYTVYLPDVEEVVHAKNAMVTMPGINLVNNYSYSGVNDLITVKYGNTTYTYKNGGHGRGMGWYSNNGTKLDTNKSFSVKYKRDEKGMVTPEPIEGVKESELAKYPNRLNTTTKTKDAVPAEYQVVDKWTVTKTVDGDDIKKSELSAEEIAAGKYTDADGNEWTLKFNNDAKEALYSVEINHKKDVVNYTLKEGGKTTTQDNIHGLIAAETSAKAGQVTAQQKVVDDLGTNISALTTGNGAKMTDGTVVEKSVSVLKDEYEKAQVVEAQALEDKNKADTDVSNKEKELKDLEDKYNAYYKNGWFGGEFRSSYYKDHKAAKDALWEAKLVAAGTEALYQDAVSKRTEAKAAYEDAVDALEAQTKILINQAIITGVASLYEKETDAEYQAAKAAHAAAVKADQYMAGVVKEAQEAKTAAAAARAEVAKLLGSATVSADELAAAKARLEAAETRLADAEAAIETAREAAEAAHAAYDAALGRVAALVAAEAAASAGEEEGEEEAPVYAILPGAGNVAIDLNALMANAPAPQAGRVAGVNRGDGAVEEIGENQVPLAGTIEEDDKATQGEKAVEISDKKVPLAGNIVNEEKTRNWWWLLLVALATAAGVGSYQYYNKQKKEELKVESDK